MTPVIQRVMCTLIGVSVVTVVIFLLVPRVGLTCVAEEMERVKTLLV